MTHGDWSVRKGGLVCDTQTRFVSGEDFFVRIYSVQKKRLARHQPALNMVETMNNAIISWFSLSRIKRVFWMDAKLWQRYLNAD